MIASFSSVVVIIPFLIIGIFGSACLRFRLVNKIRPIIDSIHGPYRDNYRYWYGARLLLLVMIAVANPALADHEYFYRLLLQLLLVCVFTIFQAYIKPFSSRWINMLDIWCMFNVVLLIFVNIYNVFQASLSENVILINVIPMSITIIVVVGYHMVLFARHVSSKISWPIWITHPPVSGFISDRIDINYWLKESSHHTNNSRKGYVNIDNDKNDDADDCNGGQLTDSSCHDYSRFREPLLELSSDSTFN